MRMVVVLPAPLGPDMQSEILALMLERQVTIRLR